MSSLIKNPLVIALDVDSEKQALRLAEDLSDLAGAFKLGPRLVNRYGEKLVSTLSRQAPVFIDCKFFDIASTMESAVRSCFECGASLVTVHAMAGVEALKKVAQVEKEYLKIRPCKVLAVTVLTSWDQQTLSPLFGQKKLEDLVLALTETAEQAGLSGVVCSAEELTLLKKKKLFKLTPGIRLEKNNMEDQKRTVTPDLALKWGADALVVGRPILQAKDPRAAAEKFHSFLSKK